MNSDEIKKLFGEFQLQYDDLAKDRVWKQHSEAFKHFWNDRVLGPKDAELLDEEIDDIIRILDVNGKGHTAGSDAVARVMIPQGAWRRMFNGLHLDRKLSGALTAVFEETDSKKRAGGMDDLYKLNAGNKNSLTGSSANAINAMLAAFDPFENLSIVSLKDRSALLNRLDPKGYGTGNLQSTGEKVVSSNSGIREAFGRLGIGGSARKISEFSYFPSFRRLWRGTEEAWPEEDDGEAAPSDDTYLFYMESQLEDFIIENWDRIEFCKGLELLEEEGSVVSQQFPTKIGRIDILAIDKKSGRYVVVELKRNQTSDDTIGQLTRYMGWVEEHKSKGKPTKGIIIAAKPDERLRYAMKKVPDVELFLYKIDFKLEKAK